MRRLAELIRGTSSELAPQGGAVVCHASSPGGLGVGLQATAEFVEERYRLIPAIVEGEVSACSGHRSGRRRAVPLHCIHHAGRTTTWTAAQVGQNDRLAIASD